jgi:amidohydrolase
VASTHAIMLLWLASLVLTAGTASAASDLDRRIEAELPSLLSIYEDLHRNPELSFEERETAVKLAGELRRLGFDVTEQVGRYQDPRLTSYGVVAVLRNGPGPVVMLRTDLDGLPIQESTGLPYSSRRPGVMHACGHDIHMTSFLGAARLLAAMREDWSGTLLMIGQPAEERGAGARAMLQDGLFERFPRPNAAIALHTTDGLAAGKVAPREEYMLASADSVDVTVYGSGGHGAMPHLTKDPVVLAAQIILALQTIVSRELSPLEPAVVTVGAIEAGTKHNIISSEARLQLTIRAFNPEVRLAIIEAIQRITKGTALAAGVPEDRLPKVLVADEATPSTYNDPLLTRRVTAALRRELGEENVVEGSRVMAAEDFSVYGLQEPRIPITLFWLGVSDPARLARAAAGGNPVPPLHSAEFAPLPGPAIRTGSRALAAAALDLFTAEPNSAEPSVMPESGGDEP